MRFFDFLKKTSSAPPDGRALCAAMTAVANSDSEQSRTALYQALLKSWLYIPTPELPEGLKSGNGVLQTETSVQIVNIKDRDGRTVTPAFTDDEALRNWDPNTPSYGLPAVEYFKMIAALERIDGILINLYDPVRKPLRPGGRITRREFEALAKGQFPPTLNPQIQLKAGQKVMIGKPANPLSAGIQLGLKEACEKLGVVRTSFYAMMVIPPESPTHTIALVFDSGVAQEQKHACFQCLIEESKRHISDSTVITFLEATGPMAKTFHDNAIELYCRK